MGIQGLWKELQPVVKPGHVSQLRGQRVGVDAYGWLHRAVLQSVVPLSTGEQCDKFIGYFMGRVDLLLRYGVVPVIVFDGASMPQKAGTDADRRARRQQAKQEGLQLMKEGRHEAAMKALQRSMDVSKDVVSAIIEVLRARRVEFLVAPREADAQLAYLCREGFVQAVASEDSDLLAYNTQLLVAKLDGHGNCDLVALRDLPSIPAFAGLGREAFLLACILSGCDYLASLPSVGLKTALKLIRAARTLNINSIVAQLAAMGFSKRELTPYESGVHQAYYCFQHHLVYDPLSGSLQTFLPLPEGTPFEETFLGEQWSDEVAQGVCRDGNLDPHSQQPYEKKLQGSADMYLNRGRDGQSSLVDLGFVRLKDGQRSSTINAEAAKKMQDEGKQLLARSSQGGGAGSRLAAELGFGDLPQRRTDAPFIGLGEDGHSRGGAAAEVSPDAGEVAPENRPTRTVWRSRFFRDSVAERSTVNTELSTMGEEDASDAMMPVGNLRSNVLYDDEDESLPNPFPTRAVPQPQALAQAQESVSVEEVASSNGFTGDQSPPISDAALQPPLFLAQQGGEVSPPEAGAPQLQSYAKSASPTSQDPTVVRGTNLCPHGYPQCGRVHSLFVKCYEGKGWPEPQNYTAPSVVNYNDGTLSTLPTLPSAPTDDVMAQQKPLDESPNLFSDNDEQQEDDGVRKTTCTPLADQQENPPTSVKAPPPVQEGPAEQPEGRQQGEDFSFSFFRRRAAGPAATTTVGSAAPSNAVKVGEVDLTGLDDNSNASVECLRAVQVVGDEDVDAARDDDDDDVQLTGMRQAPVKPRAGLQRARTANQKHEALFSSLRHGASKQPAAVGEKRTRDPTDASAAPAPSNRPGVAIRAQPTMRLGLAAPPASQPPKVTVPRSEESPAPVPPAAKQALPETPPIEAPPGVSSSTARAMALMAKLKYKGGK